MSNSTYLGLPYLEASQAQKHVTVNEALARLDAQIHLSVLSRVLATPPATPVEGDRYLVAAAATAAWSGQSGKLALWLAGAWVFVTPREGKVLAFHRNCKIYSCWVSMPLLTPPINWSCHRQRRCSTTWAMGIKSSSTRTPVLIRRPSCFKPDFQAVQKLARRGMTHFISRSVLTALVLRICSSLTVPRSA
jgi:hypothetical protein